MADWKQITARIRRARGSRDPGGQLAVLYEKTNDAMVAFELGRHFEITKDPSKSLEWYLIAAKRFRRGDWKSKAREAVVRLGGELPPDSEPTAETVGAAGDDDSPAATSGEIPSDATRSEAAESPEGASAQDALGTSDIPENADVAEDSAPASDDKKRRRRGRRGGRNRRK